MNFATENFVSDGRYLQVRLWRPSNYTVRRNWRRFVLRPTHRRIRGLKDGVSPRSSLMNRRCLKKFSSRLWNPNFRRDLMSLKHELLSPAVARSKTAKISSGLL